MPRAVKRLLKCPWAQALIARLLAGYIRLVMATGRTHYDRDAQSDAYVSGEKQCIFAFWHGRLFLCSAFKPRGRAMHVLISGHRDGVLISRVIKHFDISTVEGSSSKGGTAALRMLVRLCAAGDNITITPDGPRGPREESAPGIVFLAKAAALPIVPVAWSAASCKRLGSWDRFMLPFPFSRLSQVVGAPVNIARDEDMAQACQRVTQALHHVTQRADAQMGQVA